jgi:hypothetical protein
VQNHVLASVAIAEAYFSFTGNNAAPDARDRCAASRRKVLIDNSRRHHLGGTQLEAFGA